MEHAERYERTRRRIVDLVQPLGARAVAIAVPACPAWNVHELMAHATGIPITLLDGSYPSGDLQAWLDDIVERRRSMSLEAMLTEWSDRSDAIGAFVDGGASLLAIDLVIHEGDLRGALGDRSGRDSEDATAILTPVLESLAGAAREHGLGAIEVTHDAQSWRSHEGAIGWSFSADPWTAGRLLESRRTEAEIRALPSTGDVDAAIAILAAHQPLPLISLGE